MKQSLFAHRCMLMLDLLTLALLALPLAACSSGAAAPQAASAGNNGETTISVSGAFALFPMMTVWTEAYQETHPDIRFDVQAGGAGKGMTDMLAGAADIAMLSREARQEELDQGSYLVPVTIDAVVGTINAENPYLDEIMRRGLTPDTGSGIWIRGDVTTWDQWLGNGATESINVYTRSDSAGAAEMWARYLGGEAQEDLTGTAVNADPGLAEAVRQDRLGIGFNNIGFAYDQQTGQPIAGLRVVPLDLNQDGQISADEDFYSQRDDLIAAVGQQIYPYPPARVLYLVTKGEPSPVIADFFRWVLTDGQAYVSDAGYVHLTDDRIQAALENLSD